MPVSEQPARRTGRGVPATLTRPAMRNAIRFLRLGNVVTLDAVDPAATLLTYLRETEGRTGTKACGGTGDCGACTVALGRLRDGTLVYEPVTACTLPLGLVDGAEVVAVEDIAARSGELHPVQQALLDHHATPCGYCAPGMAMTLFTLYHRPKRDRSRAEIAAALAGNLCRCSGYRAVIDAALQSCKGTPGDRHAAAAADTARKLKQLRDGEDVFVGDETSFFAAPADLDTLSPLIESHPDAALVAGATGLGRTGGAARKMIHIGRIADLDRIEDAEGSLILGPLVSLAVALPHLSSVDRDLGLLVERIGAPQMRTVATVGGSLLFEPATAELPPALIALDATVELSSQSNARTLPVEDLYREDGRPDLAAGEILSGLMIPKLGRAELFRCYKVSRRHDNDGAAVVGAFRFTLEEGHLVEARIAFSGIGSAPLRASGAEDALTGIPLSDSSAWGRAFRAIRGDFSPPTDERASSRYRIDLAHALLGKALIETAGANTTRTRVTDHRETVSDAVG